MLRVDPVADREKGLWSAARDADCASWLRPENRVRPESRWLSTRYIGVLGSHRYKVVLGLAQLGGPPSGRVGPWRSGDCKSSFPDTFEPERIRTTQCESVQLWQ